jgi:ABC-type metal ion transport system, ATPase component
MTDVQATQDEANCRARQVTVAAGAVSLRNIYKTYQIGGKVLNALDGINLEVQSGEIYGIIGRSGAGKSTLVRCINMLERPTSGDVIVGKWNMSQLNASQLRVARRNIGMIFQHFNLLSSRTVRQNIALPLELEGTPRASINRRVNDLMALVGLSELAGKYVSQISGGQKQRVGIARALANNPRVLLSDEATSALDPETTRSTLTLLERLNQELGITIIMITHQMEVVQRICDRVAVIDKGIVVEEGTVGEVFGEPRTTTAASLVSEATGQVLPAETVAGLLRDASSDTKIWRISGHQADVLTKLIGEFNLNVTLIQALVEDYQGVSLGTLLVRVEGSLVDRLAAKKWAQTAEVEIEEVDHVE